MAAPTITKLAIKVGGGASATYPELTLTDTTFAKNMDSGTNLSNRTLAGYASAKSYIYLSNEVGTKPFAEIDVVGTTTSYAERILNKAGDTSAAAFDLYDSLTIYVVAQANANLGTDGEITADTADIGTYTISVTATLNKIVTRNSFTVGLGNTVALDITNYTYATGGIDIKTAMGDVVGPTFYGILRAEIWDTTPKGGYAVCYNKSTGKAMVFKADNAELAANTVINGTIFILKA